MSDVFVDLVMDNGELVRITCPVAHEDELTEAIDAAMKVTP